LRARPAARLAQFRQGDAMSLPFPASSFDAAVMALVIFFVPDPVKGVAEMMRVVAPGGTIATYVWDVEGGGRPTEPIDAELRAVGLTPPLPPSYRASRMDNLRQLWTGADRGDRDARDHGAAELCRFRRFLVDHDNLGGASGLWTRPCFSVAACACRRGRTCYSKRMPRGGSPTARAPTR
jgi:SAM-dependent methyltransferase